MTYEELKNLSNKLNEVYEERRRLYNLKDEIRTKKIKVEQDMAPMKEMVNNFEKQMSDRDDEILALNKKEAEIKNEMEVATYNIYINLTKDWVYKDPEDEETIAFRNEEEDKLYVYSDNTLKVFSKFEDRDTKTTDLYLEEYINCSYEEKLDDLKSDAQQWDGNFLREEWVDEVRYNWFNDSLADYLEWVLIETVDKDNLAPDRLDDEFALKLLEDEKIIDLDENFFDINRSFTIKHNIDNVPDRTED